jgi:hypothetical protein
MNIRFLRLSGIGLASILIGTACQPKAATPQVDTMATAVAQVAYSLLTQTAVAAAATAAAATPTPPPPTITITPSPTATVVIPLNQSGQPKLPQTLTDGVSCWLGGPGGTWPLDSHLLHGKGVQVIGVGSVPGWLIIRHPKFHNPCWILESDLKIFPGTDISTLPVMTPGPPHMGQ